MLTTTRSPLMQVRVWVAVICLVVAGAVACESADEVVIVNGTEETIMIGLRPDLRTVLEPGESMIILAWWEWADFIVYDNGNTRLVEFAFSQQELEAMDFRVTIRDADLRVSE